MNDRIAEAENYVKEAQKCMKTSLLKWSPNLDGAADCYSKAALSYRNAKSLEKALECYKKSAEIQRQADSLFNAAKAYEQAAACAKELKNLTQSSDLMLLAGDLLVRNGTHDSAVQTYERAAKGIESSDSSRAIEFYRRIVNVADMEDRPRQAAEAEGKIARLQLRDNKFDEARQSFRREVDLYAKVEAYEYVTKLMLALFLIELQNGDEVAAGKVISLAQSYPMFAGSDEQTAVYAILSALDGREYVKAANYLNSGVFKHLDVEVARLARQLAQRYEAKSAGGSGRPGGDARQQGSQEFASPTSELSDPSAPNSSAGHDGPVADEDDLL